jgi:ribosomal protein S17E
VAKADELGDKFLTKFDEKVPIVKSETKEIQNTIVGYVNWPLETANTTKDWAFNTYKDEYKKCGEGYVAGGKAVITTSLVLSSDVLKWISSFLQGKKEQAKEIASK